MNDRYGRRAGSQIVVPVTSPEKVRSPVLFMKWSLISLALVSIPTIAAGQGLGTPKLDQVIGRSGQKRGELYKFGFPRTDLHVTVQGVTIRPGLALGSWAAFSGTDTSAMVMGDLERIKAALAKVRSK